MAMHWHELKKIMCDMETNLHEARAKIHKAYEHAEKCKAMADWQCDMAAAHINFNAKGHELAKRGLDEIKALPEHDPMRNVGKWEAYMERLEDMQPHMAEIKAMIDNYK